MTGIKCFKNQDYQQLIKIHNEKNLFEDPHFPAKDISIYYTKKVKEDIVWKRPKQINPNAQFVIDGFSRLDFNQGANGNCWFIAGCVGIIQSKKLFSKVVPDDQSFSKNYAGLFHFRFYVFGQWIDVVIDDRLPCYPDGKLLFASNKKQPEFWPALLEKAYAKLYGNYENLSHGNTTEALVDMSGGLEEKLFLKKLTQSEKDSLWTIIFQAYNKNSIMGCSILPDSFEFEAICSNGLVKGHAYAITKLVYFELKGKSCKLVRIRNPWGSEIEWRGAWSDNSSEWNECSESIKKKLGVVKENDGEFWMSFKDFLNVWDVLEICHLSLNSFSDSLVEKSHIENLTWRKLQSEAESVWKCKQLYSEWRVGKNAGGLYRGYRCSDKYWTNPQFLITVHNVDVYDSQNKATVIIALMQNEYRLKRFNTKNANYSGEFIEFKLWKVKENSNLDQTKSLSKFTEEQLYCIGSSGSYINAREVTKRFKVDPGDYVIIPCTYEADHSCEFMLRIFTEQLIGARYI